MAEDFTRTTSESPVGSNELLNVRTAKENLILVAAQLLQTCQISEYPEDNPKTTPKSVLGRIVWNNNRIKALAARIRNIADSI